VAVVRPVFVWDAPGIAPIPASVSLIGAEAYFQFAVGDPKGAFQGLSFTQERSLLVGR
jgi:hypothetical protein